MPLYLNPSVLLLVAFLSPGLAWVWVNHIRARRDVEVERLRAVRVQLEVARDKKEINREQQRGK